MNRYSLPCFQGVKAAQNPVLMLSGQLFSRQWRLSLRSPGERGISLGNLCSKISWSVRQNKTHPISSSSY